jgi:hypothetical protein
MEYEVEEAYFINLNNYSFTAKIYKDDVIVLYFINFYNPRLISRPKVDPSIKIKLPNKITIYGNDSDITAIKEIIK